MKKGEPPFRFEIEKSREEMHTAAHKIIAIRNGSKWPRCTPKCVLTNSKTSADGAIRETNNRNARMLPIKCTTPPPKIVCGSCNLEITWRA